MTEAVRETFDFMIFSYDRSQIKYKGLAMFELVDASLPEPQVYLLDINPDRQDAPIRSYALGEAQAFLKESGVKPTLHVTSDRNAFLGMYSGKVSIASVVLGRKITVHNWAVGELSLGVFDFSSSQWKKFYAIQEAAKSSLSSSSSSSDDATEALLDQDLLLPRDDMDGVLEQEALTDNSERPAGLYPDLSLSFLLPNMPSAPVSHRVVMRPAPSLPGPFRSLPLFQLLSLKARPVLASVAVAASPRLMMYNSCARFRVWGSYMVTMGDRPFTQVGRLRDLNDVLDQAMADYQRARDAPLAKSSDLLLRSKIQ